MPTLNEWLTSVPFRMSLSSSFFGFFGHAGVVRALEERELRPAEIAGSSAGALVAALWAAGLDGEDIAAEFLRVERRDFWDPWPGLGLLRGRKLRRRLEAILPVRRFEDCRCPLHLSAYDVLRRRTVVLSKGELVPALYASIAVPGLFWPAWRNRRPYLDGGLRDPDGGAAFSPSDRVLTVRLMRAATGRRPQTVASPNRCDLTLVGLPRPGPFHLERGGAAHLSALHAARAALKEPLDGGTVRAVIPCDR